MLMSLLSNPATQHTNNNNNNEDDDDVYKHNYIGRIFEGCTATSDDMAQKQQVNHLNNLLSAASTNASILLENVDATLTPLRNPSPRLSNEWQRLEPRTERNLWRIDEILEMLNTMQELHALDLLNDKTVKSETVFREVEQRMNKKGYCKKSHVQIWTKWKFLKSTYTTSKRNGIKPKMIAPQIYDTLHIMLSNNNAANISGRTQLPIYSDVNESGNSRASNNEDSDNSSRIVISGVESKYIDTQNSKPTRTDSEDDNALAHPIFGFRLGLVKQEPIDTGYESMVNGATDAEEQPLNTTAQLRFRTNFKQEQPTAINHSCNLALNSNNNYSAFAATTTTTTNVPSTLNSTKTTPQDALPKLRIAQFAKENSFTFNQDPPVNSVPTHSLRIANIQAAGELNSNKTIKINSCKQQNIGNDVTQQQQPSSRLCNSSGMQMRLKNTPLRRTPMPEQVSLELPKQYNATETDYMSYKPTPIMNSKKAKKRALREAKMAAEMQKKRKRQLLDYGWPEAPNNEPEILNDYFDDDDDDDDEEQNMIHETAYKTKSKSADDKSFTFDKDLFGQLLKEFQTSLFSMQREMINEFYLNQMQLVRKEHEFQMKQDMLMLQAYKKQSEHFWTSARDFMGMNNNNNAAAVKVSKEQSTQTKLLDGELKITRTKNEQHTSLDMATQTDEQHQEQNLQTSLQVQNMFQTQQQRIVMQQQLEDEESDTDEDSIVVSTGTGSAEEEDYDDDDNNDDVEELRKQQESAANKRHFQQLHIERTEDIDNMDKIHKARQTNAHVPYIMSRACLAE